jgi:hypothetical protein
VKEGVFRLVHRAGTGYTQVVATAVQVSGPSADGMVHLNFCRDMVSISAETGLAKPTQDPDAFEVTLNQVESEPMRLDVALVSIPAAAVPAIIDVLSRHHESTKIRQP